MVRGTVSQHLEAIVRVRLRGPLGTVVVDAIVDTGFNGAIAIPTSIIQQLGLSQSASVTARLADGATVSYGVFPVQVDWDGTFRWVISSGVGDECLLGMKLLAGSELRILVKDGGEVEIVGP